MLLFTYAAYLWFQLKTHAGLYDTPSPKNDKIGNKNGVSCDTQQATSEETQDKEAPSKLSRRVAILTLAVSTALVGICAEFLTSSINKISPPDGSDKLSRTFISLILLSIVENATEHLTAVWVAMKDKMDLAVSVAIGSTLQIALLVIPCLVVLGWILQNLNMDLVFDGFQIAELKFMKRVKEKTI